MEEYIRYFTQEKSEPFIIEISGKSWCDGTYRLFREKARIWVIEYILSGRGYLQVIPGNHHCTPQTDDVYLLPPGRQHLYYSDAEDPWEKIFVNLRGPVVDSLTSAYGLSDKIYFPQVPSLKNDFIEIYELMRHEELPDRYVLEQTELILHRIFRQLGKLSARESTESNEIRTVRRYLDEHVRELVSIETMSSLIYRSPDYLIKHFKTEVGCTPYQYLLRRKIMIAKRLLQDTTLSVQDVSAQVGYSDAHYFSGMFKKETGSSPSEFRKSHQAHSL